jgi:hypothetical protein
VNFKLLLLVMILFTVNDNLNSASAAADEKIKIPRYISKCATVLKWSDLYYSEFRGGGNKLHTFPSGEIYVSKDRSGKFDVFIKKQSILNCSSNTETKKTLQNKEFTCKSNNGEKNKAKEGQYIRIASKEDFPAVGEDSANPGSAYFRLYFEKQGEKNLPCLSILNLYENKKLQKKLNAKCIPISVPTISGGSDSSCSQETVWLSNKKSESTAVPQKKETKPIH